MLVKVAADELGDQRHPRERGAARVSSTPTSSGSSPRAASCSTTTSTRCRSRASVRSTTSRRSSRFLAGPESTWITGQMIGIDGGHQLAGPGTPAVRVRTGVSSGNSPSVTPVRGAPWISTSRDEEQGVPRRGARLVAGAREAAARSAPIRSTSTSRAIRRPKRRPAHVDGVQGVAAHAVRRGLGRHHLARGRGRAGRARAGSSASSTRSRRASTSPSACSRSASGWRARRSSRGGPRSSRSASCPRC